jgi:hypothetical protein
MEIGVDFLDAFSSPKTINKGTIGKTTGECVPYIIELGLSKSSILECNKWKDFITNIIIEFVNKNPDVKDYEKVLQEDIMLEDYHWNWSKKALFYSSSGYDWFFLKTSEGIQSVCLVFHPKESVFQKISIFYIQYVSSAPWNRKSSLHERKYRGVGKEIIKQVLFYFLKKYRYGYGFSLHSLPQAQNFYENLGMTNIPEYNDEKGLPFYEMSKENAILFLEENHAGN